MPACPFCAIINGDAPADEVWRDDVAVAFLDRSPLFPGHVLVVPIDHVVTLPELEDPGPFFERVQWIAAAIPANGSGASTGASEPNASGAPVAAIERQA